MGFDCRRQFDLGEAVTELIRAALCKSRFASLRFCEISECDAASSQCHVTGDRSTGVNALTIDGSKKTFLMPADRVHTCSRKPDFTQL